MNSETGGILGIFGFLVSMGGAIYAAINHKKVRCTCCGKNLDMSVDVDSTEDKKEQDEKEQKDEEPEEEAPVRVPARRSSIHDDDKEVEKKHYRKTKVAPIPEEV
jgi:hypothetical protein